MNPSEIIWQNTETFGCEHLKLFTRENSFHIKSTVIYLEQSSPVQIHYQMVVDRLWHTKKVEIQNCSGQKLQLDSDGQGYWRDRDGLRIKELEGAIDVDISATPFTNSLPINRLDWLPNQPRGFEIAYVSIPSLEVSKAIQTYTYIESRRALRLFNFQSGDFESLISVDEKGFVRDYPGLFTRRY